MRSCQGSMDIQCAFYSRLLWFILKIHQTQPIILTLLTFRSRNVNNVRIIGRVVFWWIFNMKHSSTKWICLSTVVMFPSVDMSIDATSVDFSPFSEPVFLVSGSLFISLPCLNNNVKGSFLLLFLFLCCLCCVFMHVADINTCDSRKFRYGSYQWQWTDDTHQCICSVYLL